MSNDLIDILKVTGNPLCIKAATCIEQILGDVRMWESQASDSWAKYQDMKKACDDREDDIVRLREQLAAQHPESWARITKRLTDERDKLAATLGNLVDKWEHVPSDILTDVGMADLNDLFFALVSEQERCDE